MLTLMVTAFVVILFFIEIALAAVLEWGVMPARVELIIDFLRFFFPYLALISISALWMGVLNSHRHFFGAAFSPVALNIIWIAGTLWVTVFADKGQAYQLRMLAGIMLFAGVVQMAVEWPSLLKIGYTFRWIWDRAYPDVKRVFALLLPVTLGFAAMQINLMVDMTLSFWIGPGANSSLWYGNRLMQLPLGLFAVGMGTALLPAIASQIAAGKTQLAEKNISFALRSIFLLVIPCSAGLIVLSTPIVRFLFERGEFDAESTRRTAQVLLCYAIGLFAHSGQKIITTGFHASQDTKTPVKSTMIALAVNFAFNLILMWPLKEAGLALATTISGIVQFFYLAIVLHRKTLRLPVREIVVSFAKICIAGTVMSFFAFFFYGFMEEIAPGGKLLEQGLRLFSTMTLSGLVYFICCFFLRAEEVHAAAALIFKRKKPRATGG